MTRPQRQRGSSSPRLSSPVLVRRWRQRQRFGVGVLVLAALAFLIDRSGLLRGPGAADPSVPSIEARDARAIDGDTLEATINGQRQRVRLIGIDAPERNAPLGPPDHWAEQATAHLRQRIDGRTLRLVFKPDERTDAYNRLLAYVELPGLGDINLELIALGHAYADRRHPHPRQPSYEQAEADAQSRRVGLWADITEPLMPRWRQQWLGKQR